MYQCVCYLCLLQSMEGAVTSQESDSETGPGEEVDTSGCSTQPAAGETATPQVPILTVPEPSKKRAQQQQPEVQLVHKASELLTTISAKMSRVCFLCTPAASTGYDTHVLRHDVCRTDEYRRCACS